MDSISFATIAGLCKIIIARHDAVFADSFKFDGVVVKLISISTKETIIQNFSCLAVKPWSQIMPIFEHLSHHSLKLNVLGLTKSVI